MQNIVNSSNRIIMRCISFIRTLTIPKIPFPCRSSSKWRIHIHIPHTTSLVNRVLYWHLTNYRIWIITIKYCSIIFKITTTNIRYWFISYYIRLRWNIIMTNIWSIVYCPITHIPSVLNCPNSIICNINTSIITIWN